MLILVVSIPAIIAVLTVLRFCAHLRMLGAKKRPRAVEISSSRYRPMLRLLAGEDLDFAPADAEVRRKLRTQRRRLFRRYLRCLSEDYGQLLAGIRVVMVQSDIDRPDLAKALLKNKLLFCAALCRIDVRLGLHALGVGGVDASRLVEALDVLRSRVSALSPVMGQWSGQAFQQESA